MTLPILEDILLPSSESKSKPSKEQTTSGELNEENMFQI
jgi:hypothetical protein